jgi:hypothetical protein
MLRLLRLLTIDGFTSRGRHGVTHKGGASRSQRVDGGWKKTTSLESGCGGQLRRETGGGVLAPAQTHRSPLNPLRYAAWARSRLLSANKDVVRAAGSSCTSSRRINVLLVRWKCKGGALRHEGTLDSCEHGSNRASGQDVARCGSGCRSSRCLLLLGQRRNEIQVAGRVGRYLK